MPIRPTTNINITERKEQKKIKECYKINIRMGFQNPGIEIEQQKYYDRNGPDYGHEQAQFKLTIEHVKGPISRMGDILGLAKWKRQRTRNIWETC